MLCSELLSSPCSSNIGLEQIGHGEDQLPVQLLADEPAVALTAFWVSHWCKIKCPWFGSNLCRSSPMILSLSSCRCRMCEAILFLSSWYWICLQNSRPFPVELSDLFLSCLLQPRNGRRVQWGQKETSGRIHEHRERRAQYGLISRTRIKSLVYKKYYSV